MFTNHRLFATIVLGVVLTYGGGCLHAHDLEFDSVNRDYMNALVLNNAHANRVWFIELNTAGDKGGDGEATATLVFSRNGCPPGAWETGPSGQRDVHQTTRLHGRGADLVRSVIASAAGADVILLTSSDTAFPPCLRTMFWVGLPDTWSVSPDGIAATKRPLQNGRIDRCAGRPGQITS